MNSHRFPQAERVTNHSLGSRPPLGSGVELRLKFHLSANIPDPSVAKDRHLANITPVFNDVIIRFEDLLFNPHTVAKDLCEFLKVDFHGMTDPSTYTDGAGQPWRQNTSYRNDDKPEDERRFNRTALKSGNRFE